MKNILSAIIEKNLGNEAFAWLQQQAKGVHEEETARQLNVSFAAMPQKTGKKKVDLGQSATGQLHQLYIKDWTIDRLCRVWILMHVEESDKTTYLKKIQTLFVSAEMNELVALYSALPIFAWPAEWKAQCAEGVRSNIGLVLEAIMYENAYPAAWLDEAAWNQLTLKAFFTDKDVDRITGLDERANQRLAAVLFDYAHERWAAHRTVNVQLWRLVGKFIDESNLNDLKTLSESVNDQERKAAALALSQSDFKPAKDLLNSFPSFKAAIAAQQLTWGSLNK